MGEAERRIPMLTNDQLQRVARLVRLAPYMTQEQLKDFLKLVSDLKAADAAAIMPQSAVQSMVDVVDDKQMQQIVQEHRHGRSEPGGLSVSPAGPKERGTGWQKPTELGTPPGIKYVDQLVDAQDLLDKRDLEKRLRRL